MDFVENIRNVGNNCKLINNIFLHVTFYSIYKNECQTDSSFSKSI